MRRLGQDEERVIVGSLDGAARKVAGEQRGRARVIPFADGEHDTLAELVVPAALDEAVEVIDRAAAVDAEGVFTLAWEEEAAGILKIFEVHELADNAARGATSAPPFEAVVICQCV